MRDRPVSPGIMTSRTRRSGCTTRSLSRASAAWLAEVTGGALLAYMMGGRLELPEDAAVFDVDDAKITGRREAVPAAVVPAVAVAPG